MAEQTDALKYQDGARKGGGTNIKRHAGPGQQDAGDRHERRPVAEARPPMTAPILQIRNKNGGAWSAHAEFPDGIEEISGFKTENETNEWIAKELQDWLDRREKAKAKS